MRRKAIIFGIKGTKLTLEEKSFLKKNKPWGIILFSRNVQDFYQLKNLIKNIKDIIKDNRYPILIDQEGGKISRLNKVIDLSIFSQSFFKNMFKKNKKFFFHYYKIYINTVSGIIKDLGININTVPVLDVRRKNSHNVIGTRSFSTDPNTVSKLGNLCINLYSKNKIVRYLGQVKDGKWVDGDNKGKSI